jgi:hypothetical protein
VKEPMSHRTADSHPDILPLELQLDLLVDEELPEDRRRALLLELDRDATRAGWRTLSLRFLERQVERRSVRDLIAGGRLLPVEDLPANYRLPHSAWIHWRGLGTVAAGLLIAIGSAMVTGYWVQQHSVVAPGRTANPEVARTNLPGPAVGMRDATPAVEYTIVPDRPFTDAILTAPATSDMYNSRRSLIIQPDGPGKAMVIPVNTLPMKVY